MPMTKEERITRLKHLITCLKCEVSGKVCDDNCPTQYEAGNMGEIIENLEEISKMLEQEPTTQERQAESDRFDAAFQDGYNNGYAQARFDYEQEPILDKIRAEIERQEKWLMNAGYTACNVDIAFDSIKSVIVESEGKQ